MKPRYSPRHSIHAIASFSTNDGIGHGHIHDLSVPGCRLETTASLRVGQAVNLQLNVIPQLTPLRVPLAVVRWINSPDSIPRQILPPAPLIILDDNIHIVGSKTGVK